MLNLAIAARGADTLAARSRDGRALAALISAGRGTATGGPDVARGPAPGFADPGAEALPPRRGDPPRPGDHDRTRGLSPGDRAALNQRIRGMSRALARMKNLAGLRPRLALSAAEGRFPRSERLSVSYAAEVSALFDGETARVSQKMEASLNALGGLVTLVMSESFRVETGASTLEYTYDAAYSERRDGPPLSEISERLTGGDQADTITNIEIAVMSDARFGDRGARADIDAGGGDDVVQVYGLSLGSVSLGDGNDAFAGALDAMPSLDAGAGNDSVSLNVAGSGFVAGGAGDDALAIAAGNVADVSGGAGADAITVAARRASVDGGTGADAIAVVAHRARVSGGAGGDAISVRAADLTASGGAGDDALTLVAATVRHASGGSGDDVISVAAGTVERVSGGAGNDVILLNVDAAGLVFGRGDGMDRVRISAGAALEVHVDEPAARVSVEWTEAGDALLTLSGGERLAIFGAGQAGALRLVGPEGLDDALPLAPPPPPPLDARR